MSFLLPVFESPYFYMAAGFVVYALGLIFDGYNARYPDIES